MIRYMLVDEDGQAHTRQADNYRDALADCGPEGSDRIRLDPGHGMAAYANDCGLVMPTKYRRNTVAACMLATLGALPHAYAGPIVFVGWDQRAGAAGQVEVCSLSQEQQVMLLALHDDVRIALGLDEGELMMITREWAEQLRGFAAWLPTAPVPGVTVLTDDEALAFISGLRGRR